MAAILFGAHRPDQEDLQSDMGAVTNVIPRMRGYGPLSNLLPLSNPLAATPLGAFAALGINGAYSIFVGTATKLYKYNTATLAFTDVARLAGGVYAASTTAPWSFTQFGTKVIAVNFNDDPQVIDVDSGTNFAALAGTPPRARYAGVFGDFLVLGNVSGFPRRVQWSGLNNIEFWTSGTNSSDFQDFPDGGHVSGLAGYDAGFVFQENAIRRMIFTPGGEPDFVFRIEKVENERGSASARSIITVGPRVFFLARDGFYVIDGTGSKNIGFETMNSTFLDIVDRAKVGDVMGSSDPLHSRVYWAFTSSDSPTAYFNKLIIYDWAIDRWSEAFVNQYMIFPAAVAGLGLEGLDAIAASIETLQYSLDSRVWAGGQPVIASIDQNLRLAFYQGAFMEANIYTAKLELTPGYRALVTKVRPLTDAPTPFVSLSSRSSLAVLPPETAETTPSVDGMCPQRSSGRWHRFRLRIAAGETWTYALGVDPEFKQEGRR